MLILILYVLLLLKAACYEVLFAANCGTYEKTMISTKYFNYTSVQHINDAGYILRVRNVNAGPQSTNTRNNSKPSRSRFNKNTQNDRSKPEFVFLSPNNFYAGVPYRNLCHRRSNKHLKNYRLITKIKAIAYFTSNWAMRSCILSIWWLKPAMARSCISGFNLTSGMMLSTSMAHWYSIIVT